MEIIETRHPHATVLALVGRLDGVTSPVLETRIAAVRAAGAVALVFDLARLDYVSSAGLRVFLATAKTARATGGRVSFAALPAPVREVFDLSGFLTVLDIRADLASALV